MSVSINPDFGDTIVISDQGVRISITYQYRDPDFNGGEKGEFTAQFPRDFGELSVSEGELEQALLALAMMVARRTNVHG
jgi:hypothetical protein